MEAKPDYQKVAKRFIFIFVVTGLVLFGSAGTLSWWNGWAAMGMSAILAVALILLVFRKTPELMEERLSARKRAKTWDKILVPVLGLLLPLLSTLLGGLDKRFGWTDSISAAASLLALLVMIGAGGLTLWAMRVNPFFSSHVRIQEDRSQTVVSGGPYAYIRHPGYTGAILYSLALPILLGSLAALWAGLTILLLFLLRTSLEDRTLRRELKDYREYTQRVRYRLMPFIW